MYPNIAEPSPDIQMTSTSAGMHDREVRAAVYPPVNNEPDPDLALLEEAQERFRRVTSWDAEWRRRAQEELNFVDGLEHWDGGMKEERKGRPCLTFDRIGPSIDQVVNDARQSPPEAKVSPVGDGADKDLADILEGLIRNIDQDSSAQIAYLTAYEHAVKVGRGWWRVNFVYEDEESTQQKIVIERIPNLFSVYPDPAAEKFDYSDMRWCIVTEDLDKDLFDSLYPDSQTSTYSNYEGIGDKIRTEWFPKGTVRVAEYWWVEIKTEHVAWIQMGTGATQKLTARGKKELNDLIAQSGGTLVNRRMVERRQVKGAKITGAEVLDRWDWPGKWIPLVPVLGKEIIKDGKRQLRGMVRPQMDANLYFDYLISKEAETVGLASIVQWLVAEGQIENHEYEWAQANRRAIPFLQYKTEINGKPLAPPIRIFSEPPLGAITGAVTHADEAQKYAAATWNPSLGAPGPETSGRAIGLRQRESDNAHFNFHDNLGRSMRHSGRIVIDLIPHIYSEARAITIFDPDKGNKQVKINQPTIIQGLQKMFDVQALRQGPLRYDCTISSQPSYASRRAETADRMLQSLQYLPVMAQRAPDLVAKALQLPEEISDRIRPPDVQATDDGQMPVPPQVQAMMAQQNQIIQLQGQQLQMLIREREAKILELESRERIAAQNNRAKIEAAAIAGKSAIASQIAQQDHDRVESELDRRERLIHNDVDFTQDLALHEAASRHDQEMQAQQAQQQQAQQQQAQQPQGTPPTSGA